MSSDADKDSDWEEYEQRRACQLFTFRCPVRWDTLQVTGDPKVRFCEKCQEKVHFCASESELNQQAALGNCAVIVVRVPRVTDAGWRLMGRPRSPGCVLCDLSGASDHKIISECGVSADLGSPDIILFDSLTLENEAFQAFSNRWVHAECLLKWKYRDRFLEAWNSALQERFLNKKLFVSNRGTLKYTHPLTWLLTDAEAERQEKAEVQREADKKAHAERRAAYERDRAARGAAIDEGCAKARRKAIAMGIATEENVNRILYDMSLDDFIRDFGDLGVSRAFFQ